MTSGSGTETLRVTVIHSVNHNSQQFRMPEVSPTVPQIIDAIDCGGRESLGEGAEGSDAVDGDISMSIDESHLYPPHGLSQDPWEGETSHGAEALGSVTNGN
ncbi:hypothetical protein FRB95_003565 [Tulasnella sp. JGI-2019a]|nr:hypothetical protein FRB95_003565 [Tulasnella sp. JGI-2019a]